MGGEIARKPARNATALRFTAICGKCIAWWEALSPGFNPRSGRVWVQFHYKLGQPPKNLYFFIVCRPNRERLL